MTLEVAEVRYADFVLSDVRVELPPRPAPAQIRIGRLQRGTLTMAKLGLECAGFTLSKTMIDCPDGQLQAPAPLGPARASFRYEMASKRFTLNVEPASGGRLSGNWQDQGGSAQLTGVPVATWLDAWAGSQGADAPQLPKVSQGTVAADLTLRPTGAGNAEVKGRLALSGLAFSDASGLHAAERVSIEAGVDATRKAARWSGRLTADWREGEVLWAPLYVQAARQSLRVAAACGERCRMDDARLEWPGIGAVKLRAEFQPGTIKLRHALVETTPIVLPAAFEALVKPAFPAFAEAKVGGSAQGVAEYDESGWRGFRLALENLEFVAPNERYAVHGGYARLPWRRDDAAVDYFGSGEIGWETAAFGKIPLNGVRIPVDAAGDNVIVPSAKLPILGGTLELRDFWAIYSSHGWRWTVAGGLSPVSLPELTTLLGWPTLQGELAGTLPRLSYANQSLVLDGALRIRVFDGTIDATQLQWDDPLGKTPRLTADLAARRLDLQQLTGAFSFGNITGRVDADVKNLEIEGTSVTRLDAEVRSSPGDYPKRISQRAVENIAALGGGGATAALQRSFLRFFGEFGYSKLGWACRLRREVCRMAGVGGLASIEEMPGAPATQAYPLVVGGGIPSLTVLGYNREVGWTELIDRLQRVTANNTAPIIK